MRSWFFRSQEKYQGSHEVDEWVKLKTAVKCDIAIYRISRFVRIVADSSLFTRTREYFVVIRVNGCIGCSCRPERMEHEIFLG